MSLIDQAIQTLYRYVDQRVESVRPFRAVVTGTASGMVQLRRTYSASAETALRARCVGFDLATDDEVLCVPMADGLPVVVAQLQRATPTGYILTPDLTLTGDLIAASINSPYVEPVTIADSAVTSSTASTTVYSVNVQNASFDLPTGTWTVYAWGDGLYAHSVANGIVRVHMQVGSDAGTALTVACQQDPGRTSIAIANEATGQSGSIEIRMEYRPNTTGTAYAGGGWLMALALRTS